MHLELQPALLDDREQQILEPLVGDLLAQLVAAGRELGRVALGALVDLEDHGAGARRDRAADAAGVEREDRVGDRGLAAQLADRRGAVERARALDLRAELGRDLLQRGAAGAHAVGALLQRSQRGLLRLLDLHRVAHLLLDLGQLGQPGLLDAGDAHDHPAARHLERLRDLAALELERLRGERGAAPEAGERCRRG